MKLAKLNLTLLLLLGMTAVAFCGVQQQRTVSSVQRKNTTNIGTNPYAKTATTHPNTASYYATVNPDYSDRGTVYHGESGTVAVGPRGAVVAGNNGTATYNGYGAVVSNGYYYDYNSYATSYGYDSYAGTNIAPAAGAPIPIGVILEYAPSTAMPLMVGSSRYYFDHNNNSYFAEVFDGGAVVYQVVPAPLGAVITILPSGCMPQYFNGKSFTVCGDTYYKQVAGGYEVVLLN